MFRISVCVCAFFLLACFVLPMAAQQPAAASANAAVPPMVNYSGVLTDVNGKPLTGSVGVTFYLYKDSQGGAPLWMETQNVKADKGGHYTAALGSTSSQGLPANVFASGEARWLGVQAQGQAEQARVLLMSVPYALKALDAETIGGKPVSSFMLAPASGAGSAASVVPNSLLPPVTGTGTPNHITKWLTATKIGNSGVFETAAGNVGIGTIAPAVKFDVNGLTDIRKTLTLFPAGASNTLAVSGTAFKIDHTGNVTFIAGQTFPGTGTVTSVGSGAGLTGGPITHAGTLSIANGGVTNTMLQHSSLTVNANSPLTGGGAVSLGGSTSLGLTNSCGNGQILKWNGASWACAADNNSGGTVTSVGSGLGLTGGPITGSGTLAINTSIVPQLGAANSFTNLNAFGVTSGSPALAVGNGSGDGIDIVTGSYGVNVTSGAQGIHATTSGDAGVFVGGFDGSYNLGPSAGVYSESDTDSSFNSATIAFEFGGTTRTQGIWAFSSSPGGVGAYGELVGGATTATPYNGTSGVWGDSSGSVGVNGTSDSNYGVVGVTADTSASGFSGGIFVNDSFAAGTILYAYAPNVGGLCSISNAGHLSCNGSVGAVAPVDGGARKVELSAIQAPENWFEDAGAGQLSNGEAIINLEPIFGETVNTGVDYHVFLTPNGDCKGLYIAQKSANSFVVRELGGGTSNIAFDYRIMAKRKGFEQVRLADTTKMFNPPPRVDSAVKPTRGPSPQELQKQHKENAVARRVAQLTKPTIKH